MDEHRVGLLPILRRVWAPVGERPVVTVRPRYQWVYVIGFVHPASGRTSFWLVPTLNAQVFAAVLRAFAQEQEVGPDKHILLVLDGAGWHTGEEVRAPPGIDLITQPPYSPEVQPAEHLWPLTDEALANRSPDTLEELDALLAARCCELGQQTERIRSSTCFHWWPDDAITQ